MAEKETNILTPEQLRAQQRQELNLKTTLLPTVQMEGPAGLIVVNQSDVAEYRGRGYTAIAGTERRGSSDAPAIEPEKITVADTAALDKKEAMLELKGMSLDELKAKATAANMTFDDDVKAEDLVAALAED